MAKPRIIIADTDVNYVIPLQLKFAEDFYQKVDLEIITDQTYFEQLFSTPQRVDVLIISEELYSNAIQRHNISYVFLMTEQYEEDQTAELNVDRIFKYTSIKEIFNEIRGKSGGVLAEGIEDRKEPQIVLVYSACGGVGKTTVAMGISTCLTQNYKRVLYLNASRLQVFQHILENKSPITGSDVYVKLGTAKETIYNDIKHVLRKERFTYLPPFKAALMSMGLQYSVFERIAVAAKRSKEYDFVIIDADSTFDEEKAKLMNIADKVLIVTEQSMTSVHATNMLVENINNLSTEKYSFVCNNFAKERDNALISPAVALKFSVNDYIEHFEHYDQMKCEDFAKDSGMQKTAFLVI